MLVITALLLVVLRARHPRAGETRGDPVVRDGHTTGRQIVSATDLQPFGNHRFRLPFDAAGKKWVRFAVWDSAGNGAFTQPVVL